MEESFPDKGPSPIWPDAPRLCSARPFPSYRHVPDRTPHPVTDSAGHQYGVTDSLATGRPWETCEAYRFGIDLYHHGFLWESHEAWEPLWRAAGRNTTEGCFVQALIRNSAALLKAHIGNRRGADRHSRAAFGLFSLVAERCGTQRRMLGVDVTDLMDQMDRCYGRLWQVEAAGREIVLGPAPRLVLHVG